MADRIAKQNTLKEKNPNSGRSCSGEFPNGKRRKVGGQELAPRSLRRLGKTLMSECTVSELEKLGITN